MVRPGVDSIQCPKCGVRIPLTQALNEQLAGEVHRAADERARAIVEAERETRTAEAEKKAREKVDVELRDARAALVEERKKVDAARTTELELRRREREVEDRQKALDLELERRITDERRKAQEEATKAAGEAHRLKEAEWAKQRLDLTAQLESARLKAEQGSQQLQGEVLELDLEAVLRERFPFDEIVPVAKGVRGGDVLQRVHTRSGTPCGSILWESKRTRNWSNTWLEKLREDQRNAKAEIAALVSEALPDGMANFGAVEGVWVTGRPCLVPLASLLRSSLEQVAHARHAAEHKDEVMETLYRYMAGPEFRQRVEAMVEAYRELREELDKERRSTTHRWAKQEKYLERTLTGIAGMHGDLRGLLGSSMPAIPSLDGSGTVRELPAPGDAPGD
jgi:hypothetical protein